MRFVTLNPPGSNDGLDARALERGDREQRLRANEQWLLDGTHHHRIERITDKLLSVESYGSPFVDRWVRVDAGAGASDPFRISTRLARIARGDP